MRSRGTGYHCDACWSDAQWGDNVDKSSGDLSDADEEDGGCEPPSEDDMAQARFQKHLARGITAGPDGVSEIFAGARKIRNERLRAASPQATEVAIREWFSETNAWARYLVHGARISSHVAASFLSREGQSQAERMPHIAEELKELSEEEGWSRRGFLLEDPPALLRIMEKQVLGKESVLDSMAS